VGALIRRSGWTGDRSERRFPSWLAAAIGLGVIAVALAAGAGPYRQSREYHRLDRCEEAGAGDCFGRQPVTIVHRRTYIKVTRSDDTETRTRVHEVTWERADGGRTTRRVSRAIHDAAVEGRPADLRTWRGEVVGVEVAGVEQWFTPRAGWSLAGWLGLGWFGLGIVLWGLLVRWWDGVFMLVLRAFFWTLTAAMPATLAMGFALYGWDTDGPARSMVIAVVVALVFTAFPAGLLWATFRDR
jgi:hypothetical protein